MSLGEMSLRTCIPRYLGRRVSLYVSIPYNRKGNVSTLLTSYLFSERCIREDCDILLHIHLGMVGSLIKVN